MLLPEFLQAMGIVFNMISVTVLKHKENNLSHILTFSPSSPAMAKQLPCSGGETQSRGFVLSTESKLWDGIRQRGHLEPEDWDLGPVKRY